MTDKKAEIKQHLEENRQKLLDVIAKIQGDSWNLAVQTGGDQWTALQMLRHLQDSHQGLLKQAERILAGQDTVPADFDLDRWNSRVLTKMNEISVEQALDTLKASHEKLLRFVDSLKDEDWAKEGYQTSFKKKLPLDQFLKVVGTHESNHADDLMAAAQN